MGCNFLQAPDGQVRAIVCSRGPKPKGRQCAACGTPASAFRLCDGPAPARARKRTSCDAPVCERCVTTVAGHLDLDFCPACVAADPTAGPTDCQLDDLGGCAGGVCNARTMCVAHLVGFGDWLANHDGWRDWYSKPDEEVPRERKRTAFRTWWIDARQP